MLNTHPDFTRQDLFGGQGSVQIWNLLGAQRLEPFTTALACTLAPNGSVGKHVQQTDAELIICTGGEGIAIVGERKLGFELGVLVALPHGETLAIENTSSTAPLHYLIIKASRPVSSGT